MPFAAAARLAGLSWHKAAAICEHYVELALEQADFSEIDALAIDETSRAKGHDYFTVVADACERRAGEPPALGSIGSSSGKSSSASRSTSCGGCSGNGAST